MISEFSVYFKYCLGEKTIMSVLLSFNISMQLFIQLLVSATYASIEDECHPALMSCTPRIINVMTLVISSADLMCMR